MIEKVKPLIFILTEDEELNNTVRPIVDKINEIIKFQLSGLRRDGSIAKHIPLDIKHHNGSPLPREIKRLGDISQKLGLDGEVEDGSTYKRTTANEKTGAGRAYVSFDADKQLASAVKPYGRDIGIETLIQKLKDDGHFRGSIYSDEATPVLLIDAATRRIATGLKDDEGHEANTGIKRGYHGFQDLAGKLVVGAKDSADRVIKDKIDKVEGAITDTTFLIKADKVVTESVEDLAMTATKIENAVIDNNYQLGSGTQTDPNTKIRWGPNNWLISKFTEMGAARALDYIDANGVFKGLLEEDIAGYIYSATTYKIKVVKVEGFGEPLQYRYYLGFESGDQGGGEGTGDLPAEGKKEEM